MLVLCQTSALRRLAGEIASLALSLRVYSVTRRLSLARRWLSSRHQSHRSTQAACTQDMRPMSARAVLNTRPISRPASGKGRGVASGPGGVGGKLLSRRPASAYTTRNVAGQAASETFRVRPSSVGVCLPQQSLDNPPPPPCLSLSFSLLLPPFLNSQGCDSSMVFS